jgi:hypothetical protein
MKHQVRWLTLSFALPSVAEVGGEAEPTKTNEHVKFAYFPAASIKRPQQPHVPNLGDWFRNENYFTVTARAAPPHVATELAACRRQSRSVREKGGQVKK